ncbi:DUF6355 family natural product biosynthesis protein [Streptomyces netropsis]|uniref:DUF6355 family natural product biosynthesis protein n=1 Tax=Streptomyces netropsis TaxID=55404 RepID=UPI003796F0FA
MGRPGSVNHRRPAHAGQRIPSPLGDGGCQERCVAPGTVWLGSAGKINGTHYVGRTC